MSDPTRIVPVGDWQVVRGTGSERLAFLHRLLTGRIAELTPGQGSRALLLTVKGHIVADLRVSVLEQEVRLVVPPGQGEAAAAALSRYAIMDDFQAQLLPGWAPLALHGPESAARLRQAGLQLPEDLLDRPRLANATAGGPEGPVWLLRETFGGRAGLWCFAEPDVRRALFDRLRAAGVAALDPEQAELLRIRAGEPRFGREISDEYFPMEVGLSGAIDYGKGCYLGQEPIVRIRDRGHLNWRLVTLRALEAGAVAPGDRLTAAAKAKAGRVTSAAAAPGEPAVALGMLHVSVPVGAQVRIQPAGGEAPDPGVGVLAEVTGEPQDA